MITAYLQKTEIQHKSLLGTLYIQSGTMNRLASFQISTWKDPNNLNFNKFTIVCQCQLLDMDISEGLKFHDLLYDAHTRSDRTSI